MNKAAWSFSPAAFFSDYNKRTEHLVAGLMSGTSMDGVDVALVRFSADRQFSLLALHSFDYPESIRSKLDDIAGLHVKEICELHVELGELYGRLVAEVQAQHNRTRIELVGCHGQTVYHHSCVKGAVRGTLQLGDADQIAVYAATPVVADFRAKDIALGGQGAPLTPYGDYFFFKDLRGKGAVLNLGGIANVTFIAEQLKDVSGFDTGPGNSLLDRVTRKITGGTDRFDSGGRLAAAGKIDIDFVKKLLVSDSYLKALPPKSTGFEMYGDKFVTDVAQEFGRVDKDLLATLTCYVVRTIADSVKRFQPFFIDTLVVAGGGALNETVCEMLASELPGVNLVRSDDYGVPVKAREAMTFALLAHDFMFGRITSISQVTGATSGASLGKVTFPR